MLTHRLSGRFRAGIIPLTALSLLQFGACDSRTAPPPADFRGGVQLPMTLEQEVDALRGQPVVFDPSSPVGSLPGSAVVTQQGQATYSIPLDVAPGVGAMTPKVALHYASHTHNSQLGVGFSLAATAPPIRRCHRTMAQDGVAEPFRFQPDDRLCWGDQRLILVSGIYGLDGAEYRTRKDPFEKIVQVGGDSLHPYGRFDIYTKDGRVLTLGGDALTHEVDAQEHAWIWAHSKTEDRFGNTIDYHHDLQSWGGAPYALQLSEIAYGGTGADASRRHVRFHYDIRPDVSWGYLAGALRGQTHRLQSVTAEGPNGAVLASYTLGYEQDPASGFSRITSVQKCDAASVCLPETTFEWSGIDDEIVDLDFVPYNIFLAPDSELVDDPIPFAASPLRLVSDFDGDGDHDLVYFADGVGWRAWDGGSLYDLDGTSVPLPWPSVLPEPATLEHGPDVAMLQPGFSTTVINADGNLRGDFAAPRRPVGGAATTDPWGYAFAETVEIYTTGSPEGQDPGPGFSEPVGVVKTWQTPAGPPIYAAITLDHNGDGLTDLWVCQGDGFKSGHWRLALNGPAPGGASGQYSFQMYDSEVGCSVHDELMVTSIDGGPAQLLVVPAFETGPDMPTPDDFSDDEEYLHDYLPRPENERTEYLALNFTPGEGTGWLAPTGLPRDAYQRWHDERCLNRFAKFHEGRPLAGAGMGRDKQMDVNGDGLVDIVRFELASGDDAANPEIHIGLDAHDDIPGDVSKVNVCGYLIDDALLAVIRPYINTGAGFEAGAPLLEMEGNAHANLWLNFNRAQQYDFNLDGITDLLLPSAGEGGEWTALLSNGDGTYSDRTVAMPPGWPSYSEDAAWKDQLIKARGMATLTMAFGAQHLPNLNFIGYVEDNPTEWPFLINTLTVNDDKPENRVTTITDGLGQVSTFAYQRVPVAGDHGRLGSHNHPLTGLPQSMVVVSRHDHQVDPEGNLASTEYDFRDAAFDVWGRGLLGFSTVAHYSLAEDYRTWTHYEYPRDAALADYPTAGYPTVILEQRRTQDGSGAVEHWLTRTTQTLQTHVEPRLGGSTFFTYPSSQHIDVYVSEIACVDYDCNLQASDLFQETTLTQTRDDLGTVTSSTVEQEHGSTSSYEVGALLDDRDAWLVGRAQAWTKTSCVHDVCDSTTGEATFDPVTGAVSNQTSNAADPTTKLVSTFVYGPHGNVISRTDSDEQGDSRTTTTTWDVEGVHPESMTNELGHTQWTIHDAVTGVRVADVSANGVTSVTRYDGMLRPTQGEQRSTPLAAPLFAPVLTEYLPGGAVYDGEVPSAMRVRTVSPDGGESTVDYAATRQTMQRSWYGMQPTVQPVPSVGPGDLVYVSTHYDHRGRVERTSLPTWAPALPDGYTTTDYDGLSRVIEVEFPNGTNERMAYGRMHEGVRVWHTDTNDVVSQVRRDPLGRLSQVIDAHGTEMCFDYGPFDRLREVRRDCAQPDTPWVTTFEHDALGRVVEEIDPEFGDRFYAYSNAFGRLVTRDDDEGNVVTTLSDSLGRLLVRTDADGDTIHEYDVGQPGRLHTSTSPDGVRTTLGYDGLGRLSQRTVEDLTGGLPAPLVFGYTFGPNSRLDAIQYPSVDGDPGLQVDYLYDGAGYLRQAQLSDGTVVWAALDSDVAGRLTLEQYGNGLQSLRGYDPQTGLPTAITTSGVGTATQQLEYHWHPWGELDRRVDMLEQQQEEFVYDDLRRLTSATVTHPGGSATTTVTYDAVGNITNKSDVGAYTYTSDGRLSSTGFIASPIDYDARGNVIIDGDKTITYTPFDKVREIAGDDDTLTFRYDAEGSRFERHSENDTAFDVNVTNLYERHSAVGGFPELRYRIVAGGRVVAQILRTTDGVTWSDAMQYMHDDHLGSTHAVTDEAGVRTRHLGFDAWGRARDGADWRQSVDDDLLGVLGVGFTGHRSKLDAGFTDMGGRMYDSRRARFLSADPVVSRPGEMQAYSRYSYVNNRPMVATDPSGYDEVELGDDGEMPEEFRDIFVPDPAKGAYVYSAMNAWADAQWSSFFNGYGTGGPRGINPRFNEMQARAERDMFRGADDFAIRVTADMCTEIADCSGRRIGKKPTYVWDLPIDEWAETAVDTATDFIPVVSQAKTVYQAIDRIQNGEDPMDVLADAAVDGATGIIPGLKSGRKFAKALDKAEDVADAAGDVHRAAKGGGKALAGPQRQFVVNPKGNTLVQPPGGKTVGSPDGRFVEARYPNGSPAQQLHGPHGHIKDAHGHGFKPGPGKNTRGPSLDRHGNEVDVNSPEAHWPVNQ
ncbi:MAG: hypothetical protein K0V04_38575 [Deltaproteobacteria bacterium]|nr:hypothetical protein [Deltaproteobacteria bacterium]